jgi:hypothetical protein
MLVYFDAKFKVRRSKVYSFHPTLYQNIKGFSKIYVKTNKYVFVEKRKY